MPPTFNAVHRTGAAGGDDMQRASAQGKARVLIIAPHGSYRTVPYVEAARRLGIECLIASEGRHSLVSAYAQGLHLDFSDSRGALDVLVEAARRRSFAAIISTDDTTTELASLAARRLGLPHNEPDAVRIARRKDLARAHLSAAGILVPSHARISLGKPLAGQLDGIEFPCVVKPLAMSASRGVIRADSADELRAACARVARIVAEARDPEERRYLLVEEFIPGVEVAVEGMLTGGELDVLAIFDKPVPLNGPYFEETYFVTPSRLDAGVQRQVRQRVAETCRAYGLRHGPVHAECRINAAGVWMLEIASRTIGGLCSRLFEYGLAGSLEGLVLSHAVGAPLAFSGWQQAAGVLMIPTRKAGILRRVEGVGAAREVPYVEEVTIQVRDRYQLVPLPEGSSYLGFIFARAPCPEQVEAALKQAHAKLNVVIAPLWKGVTGIAA